MKECDTSTFFQMGQMNTEKVKRFLFTSLLGQAWELHSSSTFLHVRASLNIANGFSCPNLILLEDGLCFASHTTLCRSSEDPSLGPGDCDPLTKWTSEGDFFQLIEDVRAFRFREIQRIEWEMASRKGYPLNFGISNLIRNNLLSHLDESWNRKTWSCH